MIEIKNKEGKVLHIHEGTDLRYTDLRYTALRGADLRGADLRGAALPIFCKWEVSIKNDKISIGCKTKSVQDWDSFFLSDGVFDTTRDTEAFNRIEANYLAAKAYLNHMAK